MRAVNKLPIGRYIAFVGSLLLAIFFIADWYLPMAPLQSVTSPEMDKSIIRIKSDRKWPEASSFRHECSSHRPAEIAVHTAF
jgi:hypothetical protein